MVAASYTSISTHQPIPEKSYTKSKLTTEQKNEKKLSKSQLKYWKKFKKAAADSKQRKVINYLLNHESHQNINAKGYPSGKVLSGWGSGAVGGKYHHVLHNKAYKGAAQMLVGHFNLVKWSKILKVGKTNIRLAWMMYAAQMQRYLLTHHGKTNWSGLNTWRW
jgi:hypothetical protein